MTYTKKLTLRLKELAFLYISQEKGNDPLGPFPFQHYVREKN